MMNELPTVYYDGGCPVCSREINFYRHRPGGESLAWVDVTCEIAPNCDPVRRAA